MTDPDGSKRGQNPNMMATVWDAGPAQPARSLGQGERFADRYEIQRELGAGGMGVVYLATDSVTREDVALKLIHPSLVDPAARERMIAEGVNTRRIRNPHVVAVYDVGEHDGQVFLSMEHVEGRPLRAWMAENMANRVDAPLAEVVKITQEILSGLAAAHKEGVIHRDLKPENILISGDPSSDDFELKILDFGIARGLKTEVFTGSTPVMGTPLYMAPEQKTTPDAVGPSADIYSVARMLYEMLMDVLPEGAWNPPSEQRADAPPALDAVIRKALRAPKHRYESVAEFAAALDDAAQGTKAADVSKSVWSSKGGDSLLASLKLLDATVSERLADGVKWLNDSIKGGAKPKPDAPKQTPDAPKKTQDGSKPDKTRRYLLIGGGVAALAVVATLLDGGDVDPPVWPDPEPNPPPDPEPGPVSIPAVGGDWRMEGGGVFSVRQDGVFIEGAGRTGGWGAVRLIGSLEGAIEIYSEDYGQTVGMMRGGLAPRSGGVAGYDWKGTLTDLNTGASYPILFHINH